METLPVDVSSLLSETGASLHITCDASIDTLSLGETSATFEHAPHVDIVLTATSEGIVLLGTVEATARIDCVRCLEPFDLALHGSVEGIATDASGRSAFEEDQEWYPVEGDTIDLLPALRSALLVELPYAPLHDEECQGICVMCGCDRNIDTCECVFAEPEESDDDSPFASLKDRL